MAISMYQLAIMALEKPELLAQKAAAAGIEPPETPEEIQQKLADPALDPAERERLQQQLPNLPSPETQGGPDVGQGIMDWFVNRLNLGQSPGLQTNPYEGGGEASPAVSGPFAPPSNFATAPSPTAPAYVPPARVFPQVGTGAPAPAAAMSSMPAPTPIGPATQPPQLPGVARNPYDVQYSRGVATAGAPVSPAPGSISEAGAIAPEGASADSLMAALTGLAAPSTGGPGGAARAPGGVAPFNPGALQPQTLAIMQWLASQARQPGSLAQALRG